MDLSKEDIKTMSEKFLEGHRMMVQHWKLLQDVAEGEKFEIEFELAKRELRDYNKIRRQERFRFWVPVVISIAALVLAFYSVWIQLQPLSKQQPIIKQPTTTQKVLDSNYLKNSKNR